MALRLYLADMIYFNGLIISPDDVNISPCDRGLLLGDGLFETLLVVDSQVQHFFDHFRRLQSGLQKLQFNIDLTATKLQQAINDLLIANKCKNTIIRLTVTRGEGQRGITIPKKIKPTILITTAKIPGLSKTQKLITARITRKNEFSPLANIKSLNYLDNVLAREEARKNHADDAILLNTQGFVAETSVANIFLVKNKQVFTPRLEDGALPGIIRKVVFDICARENINCVERQMTIDNVYAADEIFMTNSVIQIMPVILVDHCEFGVGKITVHLQDLLLKESRDRAISFVQ